MSMNWKAVTREHVARACALVAKRAASSGARGLFVVHEGRRLPAKEVARVAYLLASSQPLDAAIKFASGESMLNMLRRHGCTTERIEAPKNDPAKEPH